MPRFLWRGERGILSERLPIDSTHCYKAILIMSIAPERLNSRRPSRRPLKRALIGERNKRREISQDHLSVFLRYPNHVAFRCPTVMWGIETSSI